MNSNRSSQGKSSSRGAVTIIRGAFAGLALLAMAVSCDHRLLDSDDAESVANALSPAGTIVPTETIGTNLTVGASPGDFSVSADGQATYDVPLWVPKGPMGMQPALSLHYNSNGGGTGSMGVGWSLRGSPISQITRCRKTAAIDNVRGSVQFGGDTYCLDGARMISVGTKEYRTESDHQTKIVITTGSDTDPTTFTVSYQNGQVATYGSSGNSRMNGTRSGWKTPAQETSMTTSAAATELCTSTSPDVFCRPSTVTYAWALDMVKDRVVNIPNAVGNGIGNYMKVTYVNEGAPSPRADNRLAFWEFLPQLIEYAYGSSTTPHRSVTFTYTTGRPDAQYGFINGFGVRSTRLLSQIDMKGPNPTTTELLKRYTLTYDQAPVSGRSRLKTIEESDQAGVHKKATTFVWEDGSNEFLDVKNPTALPTDSTQWPYHTPVVIADLNGDGSDDMIYDKCRPNGGTANGHVIGSCLNYRLSQFGYPTSTPGPQMSSEFFALNSFLGNNPVYGIDFNSDGYTDILDGFPVSDVSPGNGMLKGYDFYLTGVTSTGGVAAYGSPLAPSSPDVIPQNAPRGFPLYISDLEGDGRPESIQPNKARIGASDYQVWAYRKNNGLFSGLDYLKSTAIGATNQVYIASDVNNTYVGDFDGTGRQALLLPNSTMNTVPGPGPIITTQYYVAATANPGQVMMSPMTLRVASRDADKFRYMMLDVNGDGLTDALEIPNGDDWSGINPVDFVFLNTGAGFMRRTGVVHDDLQYWFNKAAAGKDDPGIRVADINQDGLPDLIFLMPATATGVTAPPPRNTVHFLAGSKGAMGVSLIQSGELKATAVGGIPVADGFHKYAQVGDFNGDGLVDLLIRPINDPTHIHYYIHQGFKADQIKTIIDGLGKTIDVKYRPLSDRSVSKFDNTQGAPVEPTIDAGGQLLNTRCHVYPLKCVNSKLWVVSQYSISNDHGNADTYSFRYFGGLSDAQRGWLGFAQRWMFDPLGGVTVSTYNNWVKVGTAYPSAFLPATETYIAVEANPGSGEYNAGLAHRFTARTNRVTVARSGTPQVYSLRTSTVQKVEDQLTTPVTALAQLPFLALDNSVGRTTISDATTTNMAFDAYDNVTYVRTRTVNGNNIETVFTYDNTASSWLIGVLRKTVTSSTTELGEGTTRTTTYDPYLNTNLVQTITVEPNGAADVRSVKTLVRGANALGQVTTETSSATASAEDPNGPGTTLTRKVVTAYDAVDAVYPISVTEWNNSTPGLANGYAYHGGLGVLAQESDPNSVVTTYQSDGFGRPRNRKRLQYGDLTLSYQAPSIPATIVSSLASLGETVAYSVRTNEVGGADIVVGYNLNGREVVRLIRRGDGAQVHVISGYTSVAGLLTGTTDSLSGTDYTLKFKGFYHDNLNRLSRVTYLDDTTTNYQYKAISFGTEVTTIDPRGNKSLLRHNELGQVSASIDLSGTFATATTSYKYGPFGVLRSVTPPPVSSPSGTKSGITSMTYDILGRRIDLVDVDTASSTRWYNAFGDVVKETLGGDANGNPNSISYWRDGYGRVIQSLGSLDGIALTYIWDTAQNGKGRLASTTGIGTTTTSYGYDSVGRLNSQTWTIGGKSYTQTTVYNSLNQVSEIDYPTVAGQQLKVLYGFDQNGEHSSVRPSTSSSNYWEVTLRNARNQILSEKFKSGYVTTRGYDPVKATLTSLKTNKGTNRLQDISYSYDANGNVTQRQDLVFGTSETFQYNEFDMLTTWDFASPSGSWSTNFMPNASGTLGGRFGSPNVGTVAYDYRTPVSAANGGLHRVATAGSTVMNYDLGGNQTTTKSGATVTYTSFDLPKTVVKGTTTTTFSYEGNKHRISKDHAVGAIAGTDHYVTAYAGDLYERRTNPNGVITHVFYVPGLNRIVAQETWVENPVGTVAKGETIYFHDDVIGSVTAVSSGSSGTASTRFDPYGVRINPSDPTLPGSPITYSVTGASGLTPYTVTKGFTGHESDEALGLINMRGRMYDPNLGRFITADPQTQLPFSSRGHDRYSYAFNNPLRFRDPSGFDNEDPDLRAKGSWDQPSEASEWADIHDPFRQGLWDNVEHVFCYGGACSNPTNGAVVDDMGTQWGGSGMNAELGAMPYTPYALLDLLSSGTGSGITYGHVGNVPHPDDVRERKMATAVGMAVTPLGNVVTLFDKNASTFQKAVAGIGLVAMALPLVRGVGIAAAAGTAEAGEAATALQFSQKSAGAFFQRGSTFYGRSIGQLAGELRGGQILPSQVPIKFVNLGPNKLIVNTRSSLALMRAGIPRSQWTLIDATATDAADIELRLLHNGLTSEGTSTLRISGQGSLISNLE